MEEKVKDLPKKVRDHVAVDWKRWLHVEYLIEHCHCIHTSVLLEASTLNSVGNVNLLSILCVSAYTITHFN